MSGNLNISSANLNANYVLTKVEEARSDLDDAKVGEGFSLPTIATGLVAGSFVGAVVLNAGVLKVVVP